jgi:hypothetical protein
MNTKRLRLPHYNTVIIEMMISTRNNAYKIISNKEIIINNIWKKTLILLLMYRKIPHLLESTRSNHLCISKNNWTSILQKINSNEENMENILPSLLFQVLLFEFSFCNGLCGQYSKRIYIVPEILPPFKYVEPIEHIVDEALIEDEVDDTTNFFMYSDYEETPLLRKSDTRLWNKTKTVYQRIKSIFY